MLRGSYCAFVPSSGDPWHPDSWGKWVVLLLLNFKRSNRSRRLVIIICLEDKWDQAGSTRVLSTDYPLRMSRIFWMILFGRGQFPSRNFEKIFYGLSDRYKPNALTFSLNTTSKDPVIGTFLWHSRSNVRIIVAVAEWRTWGLVC